MKASEILKEATTRILGVDEANRLLKEAQDETITAYKSSEKMIELIEACNTAVLAMQNMRTGRFQGATARLQKAMQGLLE